MKNFMNKTISIKIKHLALASMLIIVLAGGYFVYAKSHDARIKNTALDTTTAKETTKTPTELTAPAPDKTDKPVENSTPNSKPKTTIVAKKKVAHTSTPKNIAVVDPVQYRDITVGVKLTKPAIQLPDNFNHLITKSYDVQISQARAKIADDNLQIAKIQLEIDGYKREITSLQILMNDPNITTVQYNQYLIEINQISQKIEDETNKLIVLVNDLGFQQTQLDYYLDQERK